MERFISLPESQILKITIPEDMNYIGIFDDIFEKYLNEYELSNVKTTNMGALFTIEYKIQVKNQFDTKAMIDELRTKNGNLSISIQMDLDSLARL